MLARERSGGGKASALPSDRGLLISRSPAIFDTAASCYPIVDLSFALEPFDVPNIAFGTPCLDLPVALGNDPTKNDQRPAPAQCALSIAEVKQLYLQSRKERQR
jgi:hypothetical protein